MAPSNGWHLGPMIAFDTESTGTSVENDRIVTATIVLLDGSGNTKPEILDVLINPGVPVPDAAAAVHGWTTERIEAEPRAVTPEHGIEFIADMLAASLRTHPDAPLIMHNAPFDLTILDRECMRHKVRPLETRLGRKPHVIDTYVLSKHGDPYRRKPPPGPDGKQDGAHTLRNCARVYGLAWDDEAAHSSDYDALMAARVAWRMAAKSPQLARMPLAELQELQAAAKKKQDAGLADYFRKNNIPFDGLDGYWPMIPFAPELVSG